MAESRTLKLSILADVDQLKKSLSSATGDVEQSSSKLGDFGKKAGLAFAVAGAAAAAYAGKLLIDGVKSAIEDEAAQAKLATTLKNVTGATNAQVAATEAYILKTSLANGITDDQLRPSLERLTRATKDVEEAQKLQQLALDIAAGSGKSLEAVSNALGKAYEGNTGALGKLGVGLSAAQLKTMSLDDVTKALSGTFGGQASEKADTFAGKMDRLKVAFDEGKETVGSFVLDAITPLVSGFVNDVIPAISAFAAEIGPKLQPVIKSLTEYVTQVLVPAFKAIWEFITVYLIPAISSFLTPVINGLQSAFEKVQKSIKDNSTELAPFLDFLKAVAAFARDKLAPILGVILGGAFNILGGFISTVIGLFSRLVQVISNVVNGVKAFIELLRDNPITDGLQSIMGSVFGGGMATGGSVSGGTPYLIGEQGPELFVPNSNGTIIPNSALGSSSGTVININVTGAIDPISTARQIANLLASAATSAGSFNSLGISRVVA